jgi:hypothetical protein
MIPPVYPLSIYAGDTGRWRIVLWADREKTIPVDLTDINVAATIAGTSLLAEIQLPNVITLTLPHNESERLSGNMAWQLRLIKPDGAVQTILRGPVTIVVETVNA